MSASLPSRRARKAGATVTPRPARERRVRAAWRRCGTMWSLWLKRTWPRADVITGGKGARVFDPDRRSAAGRGVSNSDRICWDQGPFPQFAVLARFPKGPFVHRDRLHAPARAKAFTEGSRDRQARPIGVVVHFVRGHPGGAARLESNEIEDRRHPVTKPKVRTSASTSSTNTGVRTGAL